MICPSPATVFGRAGALPSLYRRTAGPEFDKSPKKFCFFLSASCVPIEDPHCKSLTIDCATEGGRFRQPASKFGQRRALLKKMQRPIPRASRRPAGTEDDGYERSP